MEISGGDGWLGEGKHYTDFDADTQMNCRVFVTSQESEVGRKKGNGIKSMVSAIENILITSAVAICLN